MGKNIFLKKLTAFIVITLFIAASFIPIISGNSIEYGEKISIKSQKYMNVQEDVLVTCYTFGMPGEPSKEIEIPQHEAEYLLEKIKDLNFEVARNPLSDKTQQLQDEIVDLADEYGLLPAGLSKSKVKEHLFRSFTPQTDRKGILPLPQNKASEFLCTFVSTGSGGVLPIIALPRLIPILMIPIPRLFMRWKAQTAVTSCGGLRSETGFIAYGQQKGVALGFWGLGFTFSLPPLMGVYGLVGYALFATVTAEEIEFYPPNSPPVISQIDPGDGEINVPLSLSEIRFQIFDYDGDLMSYTVTTTPDIGSGNGNLKPDGVYSVPISGLRDLTEYSWHIEVTDGMDTTTNDFIFTTEAIAPIISNPSPHAGARNVPVDLSHLSFHLKDFQGDPMDYTVETVPDIGSGSGSGVEEGTYSIPLNGVDYSVEYTWFVNTSDGEHETDKIFNFKTRPIPAPWWNDEWMYRKEIFVDYSKVEGELDNFPILIDLGSDSDLSANAQDDGNDIVFTDYSGTKLSHEIEVYDSGDGKLIAWANVPNLTPDSILYMYYGNSDCCNQQNIEGTWDSDYVAVYHMHDETSSSVKDSTGNGFTGTKSMAYGPAEYDGKIHKCQFFDGNDRIDAIDDSAWDAGGALTLSLWVAKSYKDTSWGNWIICHDSSAYKYMIYASKATDNWALYGVQPTNEMNPGGHFNYGSTLQYVVGTFDRTLSSNRAKYYSDGVLLGQSDEHDEDIVAGDEGFTMGYGDGNFIDDAWIDEVRISKIARSSERISTEYNNQNDPSSFMTFGPEEPAP